MADLAAAPAPERAALADDSEHHEHKEEDYGAVVKREPLCVVCTGKPPSVLVDCGAATIFFAFVPTHAGCRCAFLISQ